MSSNVHLPRPSRLLKVLALREKALGPSHPDVATSLNNLAVLNYDQGAFRKADHFTFGRWRYGKKPSVLTIPT